VTDVRARCGLVDVATTAGHEGSSEVTGPPFREDQAADRGERTATVGPDPASPEHQDVGDAVVGDEGCEFLEVDERGGLTTVLRTWGAGEERCAMPVHVDDGTDGAGAASASRTDRWRTQPPVARVRDLYPELVGRTPPSRPGSRGFRGSRRSAMRGTLEERSVQSVWLQEHDASSCRWTALSTVPRTCADRAGLSVPHGVPGRRGHRGKKKRRHLLGGTGAARTPADWGESWPAPPGTSPAGTTVPQEPDPTTPLTGERDRVRGSTIRPCGTGPEHPR